MERHFRIEIEFSEDIQDKDVNEITENILDALIYKIESGSGLAPKYQDVVTRRIRISTINNYPNMDEIHKIHDF